MGNTAICKLIWMLGFLAICSQVGTALWGDENIASNGTFFNESWLGWNNNAWNNTGWGINTAEKYIYTDVDADLFSVGNWTAEWDRQYGYFMFQFKHNITAKSQDVFFMNATDYKFQLRIRTTETNFTAYLYSYATTLNIMSYVDLGVARDQNWHNLTFYRNSTTAEWCLWINIERKWCNSTTDREGFNRLVDINQGSANYENYMWGPILFFKEVITVNNTAISTPYFMVKVNNEYDSTALTNISAVIAGTDYTSLNGTIYTAINASQGLVYNITIRSNASGGYFNKTYWNFNTSANLTGTLHQAELYLNAYEKISNLRIYNGSFSAGTYMNDSVMMLKKGTYQVTFNKTGFYNRTANFTVTALYNSSDNISNVSSALLNITVNHTLGKSLNFELNITLFDSPYSFSEIFTGENISISLIKGNYSLRANVTGYFPQSKNFDVSNFNSTYFILYAGEIRAAAYDKVRGTLITNPSFSTNDSGAIRNYNESILFLPLGNYELLFNKTSYYNQTYAPLAITGYNNLSINFNATTTSLNISCAPGSGGIITNFVANVTYIDPGFSYSEIYTTTTGYIYANLTPGNFSIIVNAPGYGIANRSTNVSLGYTKITFVLTGINSFNIRILDEISHIVLGERNISLEFISQNMSSGIRYTSNGTYYIDSLTPGDYTIRFSADSFAERFYFIYLENGTAINLTLYLLDFTNNSVSNVSTYITDSFNRALEGAIVKVQKYDPTSNNFFLISMWKTNFEGLVVPDLMLNTEYYKFVIEYLRETRKITNATYIFSNTLSIKVKITEPVGELFYNPFKIASSLTYNNNTNMLTFTFNDAMHSLTEGCLYVYRFDAYATTIVNTSCVAGSTGTINIGLINASGLSYLIQGRVTYSNSGNSILVASKSIKYSTVLPKYLGNWGWFMVLILTAIIVFIGYAASIAVGIVLAPLPLLIASVLNIVVFSIGLATGLELVAIIIAYMIAEKG